MIVEFEYSGPEECVDALQNNLPVLPEAIELITLYRISRNALSLTYKSGTDLPNGIVKAISADNPDLHMTVRFVNQTGFEFKHLVAMYGGLITFEDFYPSYVDRKFYSWTAEAVPSVIKYTNLEKE